MSQALHGLLPQFAHMHVQSFRLWIYSAHTLHIVDPIMDDLFESLRDENRPHPGNRTEERSGPASKRVQVWAKLRHQSQVGSRLE